MTQPLVCSGQPLYMDEFWKTDYAIDMLSILMHFVTNYNFEINLIHLIDI